MKIQKIFSLILMLLLITLVTVPAVSAGGGFPVVIPVAVAVPELAEVVGGATVIVGGATLMEIGEQLGIKWDEATETFDNFASSVGKKLSNIISGGEWVDASSPEAKAVLAFDYYTATSGSGGKKDDKLYHKAKRDEATGKVKINTERISEKDAAKELKEGRDIFTVTKELAEKVLDRAFGEGSMKKFENHGLSKDGRCCKKGYYDHYHPANQPVHPHCWIWDTL